jgi:hypothetical protein
VISFTPEALRQRGAGAPSGTSQRERRPQIPAKRLRTRIQQESGFPTDSQTETLFLIYFILFHLCCSLIIEKVKRSGQLRDLEI